MKIDVESLKNYKNALFHKAFDEKKSRGRKRDWADDELVIANLLSGYDVDINSIIDSKAFRRLFGKTQVFLPNDHGHIRSRGSHTMEVKALGKIISSFLGLNTSLVEAIADGHDIGHVPFGHLGEEFISNNIGRKFKHGIFSAIIAQEVERSGYGLNLSYETLQGIIYHSLSDKDITFEEGVIEEYKIVKIVDKIAYIFADIQDLFRSDFEDYDRYELNKMLSNFGKNQRERIQNCIIDLIKQSSEKGTMCFSNSELSEKFNILKQWKYNNIYHRIPRNQYIKMLEIVYENLHKHTQTILIDPLLFLSFLTDHEVQKLFSVICKKIKLKIYDIESLSAYEISKKIMYKSIDMIEPDFSWVK